MKKKIYIEGMSCGHCVRHVSSALSEVEGVSNVEVNLEGKYATVEVSGVEDGALKFSIEDAGYDVVKIEEI